jgi:hypothetical protein
MGEYARQEATAAGEVLRELARIGPAGVGVAVYNRSVTGTCQICEQALVLHPEDA